MGIFSAPKQSEAPQPTRVAGVQVSTSVYGKAVPLIYGTQKVAPNCIWYGGFQSHAQSSGGGGGGDKGGGGGGSSTTTYTYSGSWQLSLGEGPIAGVGSIWTANNATATTATAVGAAVFTGVTPQLPWDYLSSFKAVEQQAVIPASLAVFATYNGQPFNDQGVLAAGRTFALVTSGAPAEGQYYLLPGGEYVFNAADVGEEVTISYTAGNSPVPSQALCYSGIAYIAAANYDQGTNTSLPNFNVEVQGFFSTPSGTLDADPSLIIRDLLTHPDHGLAPAIPSGLIGDLSGYSAYCSAAGLLLSVALTEQQPAATIVDDIAKATNCDIAWRGGTLQMLPRGDNALTANGASWSPPALCFAFTDDDWTLDAQATTASGAAAADPVVLTRKRPQDAINRVTLEFLNRANSYNPETVTESDLASILTFGLNAGKSTQAHCFATAAGARASAQLMLQRAAALNSWSGTTCPHTDLVEIGDLGTITSACQGLLNWPVRVTERTDNADGSITWVFEDYCASGALPALPAALTQGFAHDYNSDPGYSAAPIIFEAPDALTHDGLEVWLATCGGPNWGGAAVCLSADSATYARYGLIQGPARMGVLAAPLAAAPAGVDTLNTLAVDLTISRGQLLSGTQLDATSLTTLCWCDGELLAYATATFAGSFTYRLSYLVRGAYGTTPGAHAAGSRFVRLDQAIFKYPFLPGQIGSPIYVKLPAFNIYGSGEQTPDQVDPVTYTPTGVGQPAAPVAALTFSNGVATLSVTPDAAAASYRLTVTPPTANSPQQGGSLAATQSFAFVGTSYSLPTPLLGVYTFGLTALSRLGDVSAPTVITLTNSAAWAPNAIAATPIPTSGGSFAGTMALTAAGQIKRPSLKGSAWVGPPQSANDEEVFSGLAGMQAAMLSDFATAPLSWFNGPGLTGSGSWTSAIIDMGGVMRGLWWLDLLVEAVDASGLNNLAAVQLADLQTATVSELTFSAPAISISITVGQQANLLDGTTFTGSWTGTGRYVQVTVAADDPSWVAEVYINNLVAHCDAPDVLDGGSVTIAASPQTVAFTKAFHQPPAVTLTAVGSASVQLVPGSITNTGFQISGAIGSVVNWAGKGV